MSQCTVSRESADKSENPTDRSPGGRLSGPSDRCQKGPGLRMSARKPRMDVTMFEAHFQTFEEPETGVALGARLSAFRAELARRNLAGFVVPRADQQQNEYVPPSDERLAWLTGFTGSAGQAIVLTQAAALFVDGRYTLQAAQQADTKAWSIEPLVDPPPEDWLAKHLKAGDRFGFDPWLHTSAAAERLATACARAGAELIAAESNPLDSVWTERPPPPLGPHRIQ